MDNKIFATPIQSRPAFKGHSLTTNEEGKKEYQFYLPTNNKANVEAEVVLVNKDGSIAKDLTKSLKKADGAIPVWTLPVSSASDAQGTLAYRFVNNGKTILDNTVKTNNAQYNEAILATRPTLSMPRQMYHLMPDNFNVNNGEILKDEFGTEVQRNHFNKFGGKLDGVIDKIKDIKKVGAKRIISTPIFGDDIVSNHGYWTVNPYQLTSSIGNINDYKKLQVELFKNGMGWVADGAFANEGIEGIHLQDIVRWGEKSPYKGWFDMQAFSQNGLKFGVLPPMGSEAEKHYDFKLINSPVKYNFDKDGNPTKDFGKANHEYDKTKPTYLQQFDRRFMDENYINTPEMLHDYTKMQLEDLHAVKNYKDGVQLLSYSVDPKNVEAKIKEMKKTKVESQTLTHSVFRNMLNKWDNFSLERLDKNGTIRNWTGKKDIVALNYQSADVQDFIANTAKYWTNETDKTLTTYVARQLVSGEGDMTDKMKGLAKLFDVDLSETELKNMLTDGAYHVPLAPAKSTIGEELKDFPLVASELPREISSLFSDPSVNNSKKLNYTYEKQIAPVVENVFKKSCPAAFENGKMTEEGKSLFRLVSSDVMRYVSAFSMSGDSPKVNTEDGFNKIELPENFNEKVFNNVGYGSSTRTEAIEKLLKTFNTGAVKLKSDSNAQADIENIIKNSLDKVDYKTMKIAKALMSKVEAGLEWRIDASKDIMDLDQITQSKANAENTWKVVQDFWGKFNGEIRKYNPKAYTIGEVTCLGSYFENGAEELEKTFIKETGFTTQTNYSHIFNVMNRIVHGAPEEPFGGPWHVSLCSEKPKDYNLSTALKGFFESGYADNIRFSHENVDNQDKPRALHGYAVNIADFFGLNTTNEQEILDSKSFKSVAKLLRENKSEVWGQPVANMSDSEVLNVIKNIEALLADGEIRQNIVAKDSSRKTFMEFQKNLESVRAQIINKKDVNAVKNALMESLDKAKIKVGITEEQRNAIATAMNDYASGAVSKTAEHHFKVRPYNYVIEDAVKRADLKLDDAETKKIVAAIHEEMLKPAFSKYKSMLQILVSLPGNPTVYAGDEFGETGFETPGNNVYVHNRNQIHRDWANDSNRTEFAKFNDEFKKIFNLRNKKGFAPLVNGDTIVLENFAGDNVGGVYRYNKDSDVISVFNTNGLNNTRDAANIDKNTKVSSIPVKADFDITDAYGTNKFVRMNTDGQVAKGEFYKIVENNLKKFQDEACTKEAGDISLTDAATYFVRKVENIVNEKVTSVSEALRAQTVNPSINKVNIAQEIKSKIANEVKEVAKAPVGKIAAISGAILLASGLFINHSKKKNIDKNA